MKVIITGGEGFIGKALAVALRKRGIEVCSIDRLNGIEAGDFSHPPTSPALIVFIILPLRHPFST